MTDTRLQFARTVNDVLDERPDTSLVFAEISGQFFPGAQRRHGGMGEVEIVVDDG